ncbi:MAG: hypothetical protein M0R66_02145 [Candidatus Omnitrophica bacterium]|nr:hypothetical protein [Candidatus Omnitrophota bacterium]
MRRKRQREEDWVLDLVRYYGHLTGTVEKSVLTRRLLIPERTLNRMVRKGTLRVFDTEYALVAHNN